MLNKYNLYFFHVNFYEYGTDVKRMHDYLIDLDGFKVVETSL